MQVLLLYEVIKIDSLSSFPTHFVFFFFCYDTIIMEEAVVVAECTACIVFKKEDVAYYHTNK